MIDEQRGAQQPGDAIARLGPEAERGVPEAPQQIVPPKVLGILVVFVLVAAPGVALGRFQFLGLRRQIELGLGLLGIRLGRSDLAVSDLAASALAGSGVPDWSGLSGLAFLELAFSSSAPRFERTSVIDAPRPAPGQRRLNSLYFATYPVNALEPAGFHRPKAPTGPLHDRVGLWSNIQPQVQSVLRQPQPTRSATDRICRRCVDTALEWNPCRGERRHDGTIFAGYHGTSVGRARRGRAQGLGPVAARFPAQDLRGSGDFQRRSDPEQSRATAAREASADMRGDFGPGDPGAGQPGR